MYDPGEKGVFVTHRPFKRLLRLVRCFSGRSSFRSWLTLSVCPQIHHAWCLIHDQVVQPSLPQWRRSLASRPTSPTPLPTRPNLFSVCSQACVGVLPLSNLFPGYSRVLCPFPIWFFSPDFLSLAPSLLWSPYGLLLSMPHSSASSFGFYCACTQQKGSPFMFSPTPTPPWVNPAEWSWFLTGVTEKYLRCLLRCLEWLYNCPFLVNQA